MDFKNETDGTRGAAVFIEQGPTSDSEDDIAGSADNNLATFSYLEPVIPRRPIDDIQL
jgi:hypothetical protein